MTDACRVVCLGAGIWDDGIHLVGRTLDESGRVGAWLRLVAPDRTDTVAPDQACLTGGGAIAPLDVVRVRVGPAAPDQYQRENVAFAADGPWPKLAEAAPADVLGALDDGRVLGRHTDSSGDGQNDRIPYLYSLFLNGSLALLRPDTAYVRLGPPTRGTPTGARVIFRDQGRRYNLMLTDRAALARMTAWPSGEQQVTAPMITVAISAPVALAGDTYSYRVVPGLIPT